MRHHFDPKILPQPAIPCLLKESDLFRELPDSELTRILSCGTEREFAPGEPIVTQGKPVDELHLIIEGTASLSAHIGDEQDISISLAGPGNVVGIGAMVGSPVVSRFTAQSLGRVRTFAISQRHLWQMMEQHPRLAFGVAKHLSERLTLLMEAVISHVEARTSG